MTISTTSSLAPGSYSLTITGTSGSRVYSTSVQFGVPTVAALPQPIIDIVPGVILPAQQARVSVSLPSAYPCPVQGTLSLPDTAPISFNDPFVQFLEVSGRRIDFTIPANSLRAIFSNNAADIGFQTGTVAGTIPLTAVALSGPVSNINSKSVSIGQLAPTITQIQKDSQSGFAMLIRSYSTTRNISRASFQFNIPGVEISCGSVSGCSVAGSTMHFDVRPIFDPWFASDTTYGSMSTLRFPFELGGTVAGSLSVTLTNDQGTSNAVTVTIP
jgi:hypothetical protein